jgi:hypothetical protein
MSKDGLTLANSILQKIWWQEEYLP